MGGRNSGRPICYLVICDGMKGSRRVTVRPQWWNEKITHADPPLESWIGKEYPDLALWMIQRGGFRRVVPMEMQDHPPEKQSEKE